MRIKEIKLYSFNELSENSQNVAIGHYQNDQEYYLDFWEELEEEELKAYGFNMPKIYWSFGYSQGDGSCFICDNTTLSDLKISEIENHISEIENKLNKLNIKDANLLIDDFHNYEFEITQHGRYTHFNSTSISFLSYFDYYKNEDAILNILNNGIDEFEEILKNWMVEYNKKMEKRGYAEIEYQNSEECIKMGFLENSVEFLEDGTRY